MPLPSATFIRFETRLKEVMGLAEQEAGFAFPNLQTLVRSESGVMAAKRLLYPKERFSEGFKRLISKGLSQYTLEAVVLEFADDNLFTQEEIETAEWRLMNAASARG
jgi:hypothetical protein